MKLLKGILLIFFAALAAQFGITRPTVLEKDFEEMKSLAGGGVPCPDKMDSKLVSKELNG